MHPGKTGLYRYFNESSELLYIGIATNPLKRAITHRREKSWYPKIAKANLEWIPTRESAFSVEHRSIRYENPKYNSVGKSVYDLAIRPTDLFIEAFLVHLRTKAIDWRGRLPYSRLNSDTFDSFLSCYEKGTISQIGFSIEYLKWRGDLRLRMTKDECFWVVSNSPTRRGALIKGIVENFHLPA